MKYEKPEILEIVVLKFSDVITVSEIGTENEGGNDEIDPNTCNLDIF